MPPPASGGPLINKSIAFSAMDYARGPSCHRKVHRGHLRIEGRAPDGLRFLDRAGRDLERQHRLDMAHWLDIWLGWRGREWDSHYGRARAA